MLHAAAAGTQQLWEVEARRLNLLVIVSDEHDPAVSGCYGHPRVQTPHLDRLAAQGTLFERAYCASPVCVPSRLALLTGRYAHQVGAWDNDAVLDSAIPTWGHHLGGAGYETVLCGRTHFNGSDRRHGFERRTLEDLPFWHSTSPQAPDRSPAWRRTRQHVAFTRASEDEPDPHLRRHDTYDADVAAQTVHFLQERAAAPGGRPWLHYCGMIHPHFPLVAPRAVLQRYDPAQVELPPTWDERPAAQHPVIRQQRYALGNDAPLSAEDVRRAVAAYWALTTLLDERVGRILEALDRSPLREDTVVLYTSDHGDMAGQHGMWQKHCFYEPSVRVPLLLRLPEALSRRARLPARVPENVSLVDVLPTLLELAGAAVPAGLPGRSLLSLAPAQSGVPATGQPGVPAPERAVFSELHTEGMVNGGYMIKRGPYKYCHYVDAAPQLFHTHADPLEVRDLAMDPSHAALRAELEAELRAIVDPEAVDGAAKRDQARRRRNRPGSARLPV
jgi:choline-sulfatase